MPIFATPECPTPSLYVKKYSAVSSTLAMIREVNTYCSMLLDSCTLVKASFFSTYTHTKQTFWVIFTLYTKHTTTMKHSCRKQNIHPHGR